MQNITKEIMDLEKKYWKAMQTQDLEAALDLTDFPCLVAGANGVLAVDKEQFKKMFNAHQEQIRTFDFDENQMEVRQLSPDAAVVGYRVRTTLSMDGSSKALDAVDTSTWIRRGDKWLCAMHTETELFKQREV